MKVSVLEGFVRHGARLVALLVLVSGMAGVSHAQAASAAAQPDPKAVAPAAALEKAAPASPDAQPAAQSEHQPKGTHEGIKVHGHWTIEVRDPDGTVRSHTEFENSLVQANGGVSLQNLLSGQASTGGWEIALGPPPGQQFLGETPCYNSITYSPCSIVSPAVAYSGCSTDPSCFPNLIVSPSSYQLSPAPSTPMVILQGTATAGSGGGVVGFVSTSIALCGLGVAPANCSVANGNTQTGGLSATSFPFSSRTLDGLNGDPNSITVTSKQTIAVTVQFSFQ